jgi:hypothetical protein
MSGRGKRRTRVVAIQVRFEPSRVAAACLGDAYECLVPLRRRAVRTPSQPQATPVASRVRQHGGGVP